MFSYYISGSGSSITGAASTVARDNLTKNDALVSNNEGNAATLTLSVSQLQGVITSGATIITDYNVTPNKVVVSYADGKI